MQTETFGKRINRLRKKANLTQKELANMLGISEPAVCKWETDSSMPDIMLLIPLARALHTDLNTLFSYEEILPIDKVKELAAVAENINLAQGIENELAYWSHILQEYPNSEQLKMEYIKKLAKLQIQGTLTSESISGMERLLLELKESADIEIKETAHLYLVSFYIRARKFEEAKESINMLPAFDFNARHMKALLFYESKDYVAGLKESQQFLFECIQNMLICLSHMAQLKAVLGDKEMEHFYAETMCQLEEIFQIPFYRGATTMMTYYIRAEEYEKALECFESYIDSMIQADSIFSKSAFWSEVYPNMHYISNGSLISLEEFKKELWNVMQTKGYFSEIREDDGFVKNYEKLKNHLKK